MFTCPHVEHANLNGQEKSQSNPLLVACCHRLRSPLTCDVQGKIIKGQWLDRQNQFHHAFSFRFALSQTAQHTPFPLRFASRLFLFKLTTHSFLL